MRDDFQLPAALIIGGHPRSGTSMLARVVNTHPAINLTFEFGSFRGVDAHLGIPFCDYLKWIVRRCYVKRHKSFIRGKIRHNKDAVHSIIFALRYLSRVWRYSNGAVKPEAIIAALRELFPNAAVVGDKYPHYVFRLESLSQVEGLARLIIYRDCRDVVSSTLKMARTKWKDMPLAKRFGSATKVATSWVHAVELMNSFAYSIYAVKYEDLTRKPKRELMKIGEWLGIDPKGFRYKRIRVTSIGKYKQGLTEQELSEVIRIAGPTMERLGYLP